MREEFGLSRLNSKKKHIYFVDKLKSSFLKSLSVMKNIALLFSLLLFATGCVQIPQTVENVSWSTHQQALQQLTHWSFSGKLAIITADDRNSLNIHWSQAGDNIHITLTNFLGSTVLEIQKTALGTKIIDQDDKQHFNQNSEMLIKQLSGLVIPIEQLQQWIKGAPAKADYLLNKDNQVASLSEKSSDQSLWIVNYSGYQAVSGINLPTKLQLKKEKLRLKFAISKWEIAK